MVGKRFHKKDVSYESRIKLAQQVQIDLDKFLTKLGIKLVKGHSEAVGCPYEFIFGPLLSTIAYFAGKDAKVTVNEEWLEPLILWIVACGRKGERKSPALKRITDVVTKIEEELQDHYKDDKGDPPQILIDYFSFEELHEVLKQNSGEILGLYDEFLSLLMQLDVYKPMNSSLDRKTFLSLNNGFKWKRSFKNNPHSLVPQTHCNFSGMIQPAYGAELMDEPDHDGLMDRILMLCPKEVTYYSADYCVPMPADTPSLYHLLKYIMDNRKKEPFVFSTEAKAQFDRCHDILTAKKGNLPVTEEDRRSIYSKAHGQIARLAGVLHVLKHGLQSVCGLHRGIPDIIQEEQVDAAFYLMQKVIDIKFALLSPTATVGNRNSFITDNEQEFIMKCKTKMVRFLMREGQDISPSDASRYKLCPPVDGKYSASTAVQFMKQMVELDLGYLVQPEPHCLTRKQMTVFRKTIVEDLSEKGKAVLAEIGIDIPSYIRAYGHDRVDQSLINMASQTQSASGDSTPRTLSSSPNKSVTPGPSVPVHNCTIAVSPRRSPRKRAISCIEDQDSDDDFTQQAPRHKTNRLSLSSRM